MDGWLVDLIAGANVNFDLCMDSPGFRRLGNGGTAEKLGDCAGWGG